MNPLRALRARLAARLRDRLGVPSILASLVRLRDCGLNPPVVIDVGAYRGDFAAQALQVWPTASVECFEPLPGRAANLRQRFAARPVRVHGELLGAASGVAVALSLAETASSVLREHGGPVGALMPATTHALDDLVSAGRLAAACGLLKLDVQGYELEVLRGAERLLAHTDAVLLELNLLDIHVGVPLMHEVQTWLAQRGFVAFDLAGLTRRPLDGALWQLDLVLLRQESPLRADKRWQA